MTGQSVGASWRPRPGAYLFVLLAGAVVLLLLLQLLPGWTVGSVPGVAFVVLGYVVVAVVAWWREPATGRATGALSWFVLAYLVLWIFLMVLVILRLETVAVTAVIAPLVLGLVWLKPPTRATAVWVTDALAIVVLAVATVSLAAQVLGWVGSWYGPNGVALALDESSRYWIPLAGPLGLDGRWAGPFVHPNLAGPVGAILLVYGATRRGWRCALFVVAGVLVLLLASSRTATVAAGAGLLTVVAAWWVERPGRIPRSLRATVVAVPAVVMAVLLVIANPGLTGRTTVWPVMADLWREHPVLGIGDAGYAEAIRTGALLSWADHAHNVFFDALVRTGVVGLGLVVLVVGLALVITARGVGYARGAGIAVVVTLIVGSLADTILHWRYVEVTSAALLLAVLMSADDSARVSPSEQRQTAPTPPRDPAPAPGTGPGPDPAPTP